MDLILVEPGPVEKKKLRLRLPKKMKCLWNVIVIILSGYNKLVSDFISLLRV